MKIPRRRRQSAQQARVIGEPACDEMNDIAFALQLAVDAHQPRTEQFAALIAKARGMGHLSMPYTNPTWWDINTSTNWTGGAVNNSPAQMMWTGSIRSRPARCSTRRPTGGC